jgi:hypothetical protein
MMIDPAIYNYRHAFHVGDRVTLKEYKMTGTATTPSGYQWNLPDMSQLQCVTMVYSEEKDYERKVTFEATAPNCRFTLSRS